MSHGNFVWYDYLANDVAQGKAFYTEAVGWKTQSWGDGGYDMWMVGEESIGGIMELPEKAAAMGALPHWMSFVSVSDADATAARAVELGGTILDPPRDIPTVGRSAVIADPQGATIGVIAFAGAPMTPVDPSKPGAFVWAELMSTDAGAALEFYGELFGWAEGGSLPMGSIGKYQLFSVDGTNKGGMMRKPDRMPVSTWVYYISTDDLEDAIARAKSSGGQLMDGPMDVPDGRIAQFADNQGGWFAFHQATM